MRLLIVLVLFWTSSAFAGAGPKGDYKLDALHWTMKKFGFDPGAQLEKITGLKVTACKMTGVRLYTYSPDFGKCLLYAFFEYNRSYKEGLIEIAMTSHKSARPLWAKLVWTPVPYRTEDPGLFTDAFFHNRLIRYAFELKLVFDYHLMNEMKFSFSSPITVGDLTLPVEDRLLLPFASLETNALRISTVGAGDEKTLSGFVQLDFQTPQQKSTLNILFETNWKVFSETPLQAHIHGKLKHRSQPMSQEASHEDN